MLGWQEEQAERRRILREQDKPSSYLDQYHDEMGGRFKEVGATNVTGATAVPYSTLPPMPEGSPWAGPDLVGDEPPLPPQDNPAFVGPVQPQGPTGEPAAPSPTDVERGSPFSHTKDVPVTGAHPDQSAHPARFAGTSPKIRRV